MHQRIVSLIFFRQYKTKKTKAIVDKSALAVSQEVSKNQQFWSHRISALVQCSEDIQLRYISRLWCDNNIGQYSVISYAFDDQWYKPLHTFHSVLPVEITKVIAVGTASPVTNTINFVYLTWPGPTSLILSHLSSTSVEITRINIFHIDPLVINTNTFLYWYFSLWYYLTSDKDCWFPLIEITGVNIFDLDLLSRQLTSPLPFTCHTNRQPIKELCKDP